MSQIHEKTTALNVPVGADTEQSNSLNTNSIPENLDFNKAFYDSFEEMERQMAIRTHPDFLDTISMEELFQTVCHAKPPIIEGLLSVGTYLFVGAPKVGKSFLVAQLAYHVSTGLPLWGFPVRQGTVLYLALEDTHARLQSRLSAMFDVNTTPNLHLSVNAKPLGGGLEGQLEKFYTEHPDTKLMIIDILQKVRAAGNDKYSYGNDYEMVTNLKQFADRHSLCLLLVHHTRKQQSDDKFDMISGTNGLMGAADGAFLLQKEKRTDNTAILDISGRDIPDYRLHLSRDMEHLNWNLDEMETKIFKAPPNPLLEQISAFIHADNPAWVGTATQLVEKLHLEIKPNTLTKRLNIQASNLLDLHQIRYETTRHHTGRYIRLTYENNKA